MIGSRLRADWPLFVAILLSVLITLGHAPYRDEWQAWMIARDAGSPLELLDNLRYEGHPWLWYLPLWVVSRFSRDILAAQILSLGIAAATHYVLWRHAPFPRPARALLLFGYFLVYEYAVFARSYGLGVLLLVLAALAISRDRPAHAGVLLGLACLTSAFTAVVAVALAVGAWGRRPNQLTRRDFAGLGLAGFGAVVSYLMTIPPDDALHSGWTPVDPVNAVVRALSSPWWGTMPLRSPSDDWNGNIAQGLASAALGSFVIVLGVALFARSPRALRAWLVGSVLLLVLVYGKPFHSVRHTGHWFLLALVCAWLLCAEHPPDRLLRRVASVVLVAGVLATGSAVISERRTPISAAVETAEWIEANVPPDAVFVGEPDWATSAVAGALDRPFWYPRTGETATFIRWYDGYDDLDQATLEQRVSEFAGSTQRPVYVIVGFGELGPSTRLELLASFDESHLSEERFAVYRLVR